MGGLVIAESTTYGNVSLHSRDKSLRFKRAFDYRGTNSRPQ